MRNTACGNRTKAPRFSPDTSYLGLHLLTLEVGLSVKLVHNVWCRTVSNSIFKHDVSSEITVDNGWYLGKYWYSIFYSERPIYYNPEVRHNWHGTPCMCVCVCVYVYIYIYIYIYTHTLTTYTRPVNHKHDLWSDFLHVSASTGQDHGLYIQRAKYKTYRFCRNF